MITKERKDKVKKIANMWSDVIAKGDIATCQKLCTAFTESKIDCADRFFILRLTDIYSAVKCGDMTKVDAINLQKQLFEITEVEGEIRC